jgi:phosphate transport system substrate-binding protein
MIARTLPWICLLLCACLPLKAQDLISVRGSTVVARALAVAAPTLEKDYNIKINFVAEINGLEIADKLGRDVFDVALYTRRMTAQETALRPEKKFFETLVGKQSVLIVVPDQVWRSGVRALTKEQLRMIYEREVKNWKQLGGEDREIVYFNREVGRGIWDLFMIFLYGDVRRAPLSKAEVLTNADDVRTAVEFNGGSISLLEYGDLQGDRLHPLGIKLDDGSTVDPTPSNIASGRYELSRPLYFVTAKQPTGKVREVIEFMRSQPGQDCVRKAGHVPLSDLEKKK